MNETLTRTLSGIVYIAILVTATLFLPSFLLLFGIFLIIEAVRQIRGECGPRQAKRHETALISGTGGVLSANATCILTGE